MKNFLLLMLVLCFSGSVFAQSGPVANNDYVNARLGETFTVNVIQNDTHPDGLAIKVQVAYNAVSHTDSTITYKMDYEQYYAVEDTIEFSYLISDENGMIGPDGQAFVCVTLTSAPNYACLDQNNIRARIQASGMQFWSGPSYPASEDPVFEFPKGSGLNTVFNSTLWVGGMDESGTLKLAGERYRQMGLDYWTGPLNNIETGELSVDTNLVVAYNKVWKLTKDEVIYHKEHFGDEGYAPIADILTWPAQGDPSLNQAEYLAPFVDVDGDDVYSPMNGDYPLIRGEQCIYFIINDLRNHTETDGEALGLEIHGMAYEFSNDESIPMNNTVFFNYKIFNRSTHTYHDTYVGLFTDFDIGYAGDDFVGCDVARGAYFGYNGDSIDGDGGSGTYGTNIPSQGIVILGGPIMDGNNLDDPDGQCDESINGVGFGDGIVDNERYGMKKFIYFNNGGIPQQSDPETAPEYYNYLKGIWKDGTAMEYGGNGHVSSGAYGPSANFLFPGMSDPCYWGTGGIEPFGSVEWTEATAGNTPQDRRGLSVMGPFTFEAGSMEMVDVAYVAAFANEGETAVETLMSFVDEVKSEYFKNPTYFGNQWLSMQDPPEESKLSKLKIFPNPVKSVMNFTYASESMDAQYKLTNIMGKIVMTGQMEKNGQQSIDVSSLESGLYFLSVSEKNGVTAAKVLINH